MRKKNRKNLSYAMLPVMIAYTFAPNFVMIAAEMERKTPIRLAKASKKTNPSASQPATKGKRSKSLRKDSGGENTSPAANSSGGVSIEVNQRTGGLEVNIKNVALDGVTDDMDVALGLVKTESVDQDKVPFSLDLPGGWAFSNVDYIDTTDQAEVTLHVSGNQFTVDANFASNLRYVRSKSRYLDLKARDFPYKHPQGNVEVHYTLMGCEGQNSYFGPNGKLWGRDDRFGNHVLYVYDKKDAKPFQAELREIIDSYGNEIKIDYESNKVIVEMPDKRTAEYAYDWNKRVLTVKDLKGLVTRLKLDGDGRVVEVEYPTGGETTYAWNAQAIPYKAADGSKQYFPAVVEVEHYPGKGSASPPMTEEYRYGLDGRYFTYWDHPFQASEGGDGLMESEDNTYTYTNRRILKGGPGKADDVWEDTTCNFLNLPIETAAYQDGKLMDSSIIHYEGETTASKKSPLSTSHKFQPRHDLPPNYSEPCSEAALTYGKSKDPRVFLTLTEFNDYGLTTKATNYTCGPDDKSPDEADIVSIKTTDYFLPDEDAPYDYSKGFCQMKSAEVRDLVTKNVTKRINALSADGKYVKSSTLSMSRSDGRNAADGKTSLSVVDANGRPTSREIRFTSQNPPGNDGQPKKVEARLNYDQNGGRLTVKNEILGFGLGGNRLTSQVIDVTNSRLKSETDALGRVTTIDYDDKNLTVKTTRPDGSWERRCEKNPNLTVTTHSTGWIEKRYKDGLDRVVKETDNLGPNGSERTLATYEYDAFGNMIKEADLYGHVTRHYYDYQGREIKTVDEHLGVIKEIERDDVAMTSTTYLSTANGVGGRIKLSTDYYNDDGAVVRAESFLVEDGGGRNKNVVEYDGLGQEIKSELIHIDDNGKSRRIMTTKSSYNIDGEIESYSLTTLDGAKAESRWQRGLLGDTTAKTVDFTAISPGMKQPTEPVVYETSFYNSFGELTKMINQKGQEITYAYDKNGNMTSMTDFAKTRVQYEYDEMNRMTVMSSGDIQQKNEYYGADAKMASGQLKSRTLSVGGKVKNRIAYEYNNHGLPSSVTRDGKTMTLTYDEYLRLKTFTDYAGVTTTYEYFGENKIGVPNQNVKTVSNKYGSAECSYHTRDNGPLFSFGTAIKQVVYKNAKGDVVARIDYDYYGLVRPKSGGGDAQQQPKLRGVSVFNPNGQLISGSTYTYERGRIKTATRTSETAPDDHNRNNVKVYTYNDLNMLIREDVYGPDCESQLFATEYEYDVKNNVLKRVVKNAKGDVVEDNRYEYNGIDQLVQLKKLAGSAEGAVKRFEYDANGNLVTVAGAKGDGGDWLEKLDYNVINQMTRYRATRDGVDVSYEYDAESLRKAKFQTSTPKNRIEFYYNNDEVCNELGSGGIMTNYLFAGGRRALRTLDGKPQMWYVSDLKDVVGGIDPTGSKQTETYNYSPYGERTDLNKPTEQGEPKRKSDVSIETNPFGYNGEYADPESGLIYLRARYYSPELMRFVSRDTYDVSNRYAFGDGDPVNNIDPSGHNALSFTLALTSLVTSIVATGLTFGAAAPSTVGAVMAVVGVAAGAVGTGMEGAKTTQEDSWNDWEWREEDTFANVMSIASMGLDVTSGALAVKSIGQAGRYKGAARSWSAWGGKTGGGGGGGGQVVENASIVSSNYSNPSAMVNQSSVVDNFRLSTLAEETGDALGSLKSDVRQFIQDVDNLPFTEEYNAMIAARRPDMMSSYSAMEKRFVNAVNGGMTPDGFFNTDLMKSLDNLETRFMEITGQPGLSGQKMVERPVLGGIFKDPDDFVDIGSAVELNLGDEILEDKFYDAWNKLNRYSDQMNF